MNVTLQNILSAIGNVEQSIKNKIAKQLITKNANPSNHSGIIG